MAKVALVTGASSGIGREIAKQLGGRGFKVIITARRDERLKQLAEELPGECIVKVHDLSCEQQCFELYESVKDEKISVLVNGAGFGKLGDFTEIPVEDELKMIDTNIKALHILTKLFLRDFVKMDRGYILNIASSAGLMPGGPLMAAYYASKSYVTNLTCSIYEELKRQGSNVHVSALCPGPVDTEFNDIAGCKFGVKSISAKYCAKVGLDGLFSKKLIIIPENQMKVVCAAAKAAPRKLSLAVTQRLQNAKRI